MKCGFMYSLIVRPNTFFFFLAIGARNVTAITFIGFLCLEGSTERYVSFKQRSNHIFPEFFFLFTNFVEQIFGLMFPFKDCCLSSANPTSVELY
jgi:hypothetical protein